MVRLRIRAQKCVEPIKEKNLVSVCVNRVQAKYIPYLITGGCQTFANLCMFAQDIEGVIPTLQGDEMTVTWRGKRKSSVVEVDAPSKSREGIKEGRKEKTKICRHTTSTTDHLWKEGL